MTPQTPRQAPATPRLLTPPEVAGILQVHVDTLKVWRSDGKGPRWIRLGTRVRYAPADINAYIAARRQ